MNEITGTGTGRSPAPEPYVDRGTLSEAWYRALYGSTGRATKPDAAADRGRQSVASRAESKSTARAPDVVARSVIGGNFAARGSRTIAIVRADRSRADRTFRPAPPVRAGAPMHARRTTARVTLPDGGNVDMLIQQRGRRVHVVAVGDRAATVRLAAALQRARVALAAHGLRLDIDLRAKGTS